jgi:hypothetical protein
MLTNTPSQWGRNVHAFESRSTTFPRTNGRVLLALTLYHFLRTYLSLRGHGLCSTSIFDHSRQPLRGPARHCIYKTASLPCEGRCQTTTRPSSLSRHLFCQLMKQNTEMIRLTVAIPDDDTLIVVGGDTTYYIKTKSVFGTFIHSTIQQSSGGTFSHLSLSHPLTWHWDTYHIDQLR